jgi:DNA-binding GntR family transcriptional regulator
MRTLDIISAVEALEAALERRILNGDLRPGEHLRETGLAQEYRVGRHTVRAAFDALVRRGLLEKRRNRGVFVRVLTDRDLVEIYQVRAALEAEAFRMLAAGQQVPDEAAQAVAALRAMTAQSPLRAVVDADLAFHRAIVASAGNRRLAEAHEGLRAEIQLVLAQLVNGYATAQEMAGQHGELLTAIERGDPAGAESAIREHLGHATEWLTAPRR